MQRYPEDHRMTYNLALGYYEQGKLEEAHRWAKQALLAQKGYFPPVWLLHAIAVQRGDEKLRQLMETTILQACETHTEAVMRWFTEEEVSAIRARVNR